MDYHDSNDNQNNSKSEHNNNQKGIPEGRSPAQQNGTATVSMICGIIGVLSLCACVAFPFSIIMGVAAIILSIHSKKGTPFTGTAIAGLVLGVLSLLLGAAQGLYLIAFNFMLRDPQLAAMFDQLLEQYQSLQ